MIIFNSRAAFVGSFTAPQLNKSVSKNVSFDMAVGQHLGQQLTFQTMEESPCFDPLPHVLAEL